MPRRVLPLVRAEYTLQTAVAAFLDRPDLSPASRRSYSQTLQHVARAVGDHRSDRVNKVGMVRAAFLPGLAP